jgi:hypothetical protein
VRISRHAISPLFAMRIFLNIRVAPNRHPELVSGSISATAPICDEMDAETSSA